jgi:hypothetical protein
MKRTPAHGDSCRRWVNLALTTLIVLLLLANTGLAVPARVAPAAAPLPPPAYPASAPADTRNRSASPAPGALSAAIAGLHLPVWSRGHAPCGSARSEVTCAQVLRAWRALDGWAESQRRGFARVRHFLMQHLYDGVANRLSTDTATFVIALMDNRSYTVQATHPTAGGARAGQAFEFHPAVSILGAGNDTAADAYWAANASTAFHVYTFDSWFTYQYAAIFETAEAILVDLLLYATMPYTNPDMASFCYEHFGRHMVYFVCNFAMRIPEAALAQARMVVDPVAADIRVFGVHLRFHIAGEYFAYSVERTFASIEPFLTFLLKQKPTVFAFASDSAALEKRFGQSFGREMIKTPALRQSDGDHFSALYDLAMLEMSDDLLLTYRSTFSYMAMARTARRAWFIDKETPDVFQISNSQASIISMLYHQFDFNDWQPSRRFHVTEGVIETWRRYFKYFIL